MSQHSVSPPSNLNRSLERPIEDDSPIVSELLCALKRSPDRYLSRIAPDKRDYRNVWSAAELQAKNEQWQLVCANVFGL